jgi:Flp pilus assembly pilin Flp
MVASLIALVVVGVLAQIGSSVKAMLENVTF